MFREVLHVDITSHSTEKKYHLLTFTVKTSANKQHIVLQTWLPNQKRGSFRWVFHHVLPTLIPKEILRDIKMIMADNDSHQGAEIKSAIPKFMPSAIFYKCGWHMVEQGWKRHGPNLKQFDSDNERKELVKNFYGHIKNWMYSFMKPGKYI